MPSKNQLDQLLGLSPDRDLPYQTTYFATGPAEYDWVLHAEGQNAFRQTINQSAKKAKAKIIVSNALLTHLIPDKNTLAAWAALIHYYDVYFWTPSGKPKKINNTNQFWKMRDKIYPATAEAVKETLAQQELTLDNCVILDFLRWQKLTSDLSLNDILPTELDLRYVDLEDENEVKGIKAAVNPKSIDTVKLFPKQDSSRLSQQFRIPLKKQSKSFTVDRHTSKNVMQDLFHTNRYEHLTSIHFLDLAMINPFFANSNKVNMSHLSSLTEVATDDFMYITFNENNRIKKFIGGKKSQIHLIDDVLKPLFYCEDLTFTVPMNGIIGLPRPEKLFRLKLLYSSIDSLIKTVGPFANLKHLEIHDASLRDGSIFVVPHINYLCLDDVRNLDIVDLTSNNQLTTLIVNNSQIEEIKLSPHNKLTKIELNNLYSINSMDLFQCKYVEELILKNLRSRVTLPAFASIKKLTVHNVMIDKLNLSRYEKLEELSITGPKTNIVWSRSTALRHLELGNISLASLVDFNLAYYPNLESLTLINTIQDFDYEIFPISPSIKQLTIYWNPNNEGLDLSKFPNLEYLKVIGCDDCTKIKFPVNIPLKQLELEKCQSFEKLRFSACQELEVLAIKDPAFFKDGNRQSQVFEQSHEIEFSLPKLKSLTFDGISQGHQNIFDFKNITISNCYQLKKIFIRQHSDLKLNITNSPDLRSLNVDLYSEANLKIDSLPTEKLSSIDIYANNVDELDNTIFSDPGLKVKCQINTNSSERNRMKNQYGNYSTSMSSIAFSDTARQTQQQYQNNNNPVAVYSSYSKRNIDDETEAPSDNLVLKGKLKAIVTTKYSGPLAIRDHRINIFDTLQYDEINDDIEITSAIDPIDKINQVVIEKEALNESLYSKLTQEIKNDASFALGEFEGELEPDTWYSLPTLHPLENKNMTIYSDPLGAIEAYWHEKHQHYYIKLKDNKSRSVKLAYIWNQNKSYKDSPTLDAELAISPHLLHEKIREKIKLRFETHPKLQFLFDDNLSVADKYQALLNYFNDENDKFTSKKIPVSSNKKIEKLLNIIQYKAGACRHRANAFMLLARYMGISANIINNPKHAFCDIPFISKGKITWKSLDLGGTSANYINDAVLSSYKSDLADTTILEEQKQELDILDINPDRKLRAISPEEKETLQQYNVAFDNRIQENVLNSNSQIINNKKVLIQLKKNHNPFDVSEKIRDTIKDKNDFLYIDKPSDFHLYLNAWQYRKNKFSSVPGPLHKLLKVGGTVVVNWSNFSANDVMRYKSVWDEVPTLSGFSADKLNVIGLNDNNQNATSAFLTRANRYVLGEQFLQKAEELKAEIPANKIFSIDLFSLPNWRQKLYGEEKRDGKKVSLAQSQFIAEIRKTQLDPYSTTPVTIEIINPPNDRDFVTLMHRLSKERRILYQGDWLHIPSRVKFILRNKPHNNKLPNVAIETNNQNFLNHDRIYLGLYNLYECRQCKDASQSTLLDLYDNNTVFYVTESIPDEFWQELQVRIKNDFPHKNFTFLLAPGVSVDGHHIENDQADYLESKVENKTIYTSNDPDFFSVQLAESTQATIIDVNPQMNLSDLMARMQVTSGGMFAYAEHDLLKALRNGKCFVLNGEISHALYQWLLPLLSEKPHIHLNNERIGIAQQQLMLVMPETARLNLKLFHEDNHQYDLDDYAELFNHSNEFKQIRQFYELAQTVPHHGDGMPASPLLSHQRITRMIEKLKLKSEFHTHNPVKGLFHYDYRKDSEEYAYLNVMGKCVFRPDDESAPRFDKLKLLVHRFDIHSSTKLQEHIWQILNCFNGSQLKKILGKRIDQMDFHALDPQKIEVIYQEIKALLHHPSTKIKKSDKLAKQLKSALAKDNAIVFIKGSTGVGKTHTLKKTLGNYYNFKEIEAWLNNTSNKDKYLFIDEANMADPNFWDFLKGLSRKPPHIEYKGKIYSNLSPQHKIVVLGNPEHYQYRHYHEFLQNYAETIYFKIDDDYIEKNILRDIFPEKLQQQQFTKPLLRAMHLIEHYNPYFVTSIRDVKSLASRVLTLVGNKKDDIDLRQAIFEACIGEFSPVIKNSQERKNFIDELQIVCQATSKAVALKSPLIPITPNFKITREKSYLVQSIMQDLAIRQQVIDKKLNNNHYYKPIIILDGESGWGKSTLLEAILQGNQFEKESSHPQKKYYVITAGSSGVEEIITQAYREGAIVILDEINLDPHLEKFLIDLEETEPDCPGFMVFSSKNASVEADRKSLSSALLNRSHMMYVDSFTTNELVNIARESHIANPDQFVMSYLQRKEEFPDLVNMRTFYEVLASSRKSFFDTSNTFKPADAQVKIKFMEVASFCMEFAKNFSENTKELYIDQVYSKINVFKETFAELSDKIDERNNTLDKLKESYLEQKEIQGSQRALSQNENEIKLLRRKNKESLSELTDFMGRMQDTLGSHLGLQQMIQDILINDVANWKPTDKSMATTVIINNNKHHVYKRMSKLIKHWLGTEKLPVEERLLCLCAFLKKPLTATNWMKKEEDYALSETYFIQKLQSFHSDMLHRPYEVQNFMLDLSQYSSFSKPQRNSN